MDSYNKNVQMFVHQPFIVLLKWIDAQGLIFVLIGTMYVSVQSTRIMFVKKSLRLFYYVCTPETKLEVRISPITNLTVPWIRKNDMSDDK